MSHSEILFFPLSPFCILCVAKIQESCLVVWLILLPFIRSVKQKHYYCNFIEHYVYKLVFYWQISVLSVIKFVIVFLNIKYLHDQWWANIKIIYLVLYSYQNITLISDSKLFSDIYSTNHKAFHIFIIQENLLSLNYLLLISNI